MSLLSRLVQAAQSWLLRKSGRKADRRARVALEPLDPRQLFSVNISGSVATAVPATTSSIAAAISINPREHKHINTVRETLIRVNVLGTLGFDVTRINPATVTLGGASPVASYVHFINRDQWPDETFVFRGKDVTIPAGWSEATVAGDLTDGTTFSGSAPVDNKNASFYTTAELLGEERRQEARAARQNGYTILPSSSPPLTPTGAPFTVDMTTPTASTVPTSTVTAAPVVRIKRREPVVAGAGAATTGRVSHRLQASLSRFVRDSAATAPNTASAAANGGT